MKRGVRPFLSGFFVPPSSNRASRSCCQRALREKKEQVRYLRVRRQQLKRRRASADCCAASSFASEERLKFSDEVRSATALSKKLLRWLVLPSSCGTLERNRRSAGFFRTALTVVNPGAFAIGRLRQQPKMRSFRPEYQSREPEQSRLDKIDRQTLASRSSKIARRFSSFEFRVIVDEQDLDDECKPSVTRSSSESISSAARRVASL